MAVVALHQLSSLSHYVNASSAPEIHLASPLPSGDFGRIDLGTEERPRHENLPNNLQIIRLPIQREDFNETCLTFLYAVRGRVPPEPTKDSAPRSSSFYCIRNQYMCRTYVGSSPQFYNIKKREIRSQRLNPSNGRDRRYPLLIGRGHPDLLGGSFVRSSKPQLRNVTEPREKLAKPAHASRQNLETLVSFGSARESRGEMRLRERLCTR